MVFIVPGRASRPTLGTIVQTDIQADTVLGCYDCGGGDGCGDDVDGS